MKKLILAACTLTCAASVFAQGTIVFNNRVVGQVVAPIYGPQTGNPGEEIQGNAANGYPVGSAVYSGSLLGGTAFSVQLYAAPGAGQLESSLSPVAGAVASFKTSAAGLGFWTAPLDPVAIPGAAAGTVATLQVRAWDNVGGTISKFEDAVTRGKSALFDSPALGGGIVTPPNMIGLTSFNIAAPVPEPSTFALAGLGAAALLIFRRRK